MRDQVTELDLAKFVSADQLDVQGAESLTVGGSAKATTTFTFLEGSHSAGTGATAVAAEDLVVGDAYGAKVANVVTYSATAMAKIGYTGKYRYLTVTVANPATAPIYMSVKGNLHSSPNV